MKIYGKNASVSLEENRSLLPRKVRGKGLGVIVDGLFSRVYRPISRRYTWIHFRVLSSCMSFRLRRVHPENDPVLARARPLSLARNPAFPPRALMCARNLLNGQLLTCRGKS